MIQCLVESSRELPLVHLTVAFKSGVVHEPVAAAGLARVTARMLRRGSEGWSEQEIEERADALGGDLSMQVGLGSSGVSIEVATRFVDHAVALLATVISRPTFLADELDRLLRQSKEELASARDDDGLLAALALRRHAFEGHAHARRIAGTVEGLSHIDRQAVVDFHRRHYTRANAVVGIAGDVDPSRAAAIAEAIVADLPPGEAMAYPVAEPAPLAGRRMVMVDKPERTQAQLGIGALGSHPRDADHVALVVANTAFGGTFSSRLTQEVRVKRGWSYGASSSIGVGRVRELFSLWSAPALEDVADCLALEIDMLERWCEAGITEEELERAKRYLRRSFAFEIDTPNKRLQQHFERVLGDLPADYHARFVERVAEVTLDEANAAVRRRIDPHALWVTALVTASEVGDAMRAAVPRLAEAIVDSHEDY